MLPLIAWRLPHNAGIGETLVGAYLKLIKGCDFVDYNVRQPGGGLAGLNELDVIGIHFGARTAYLCEVATHIRRLLYKNNEETVRRVREKYEKQRTYAEAFLSQFDRHVFMFWSPNVPVGFVTEGLAQIERLELVINGEYKRCVEELLDNAQEQNQETGNPVFRVFQIIGALRD